MIIGVVGKANVGKSTLFKALTMADVEIANYPFATIKPNHGIGFVSRPCVDTFFNTQCNPREGFCVHHMRFVPVNMIDVAGLVPGAHEGKGMGNQFLDDLRQADVLIHVIDASGGTNERGEPVGPGNYDPADDVRFLEVELDMWYLNIIKRGWDKFARQVIQEQRDVDKALTKQLTGLKVDEDMIKQAIRELNLNKEMPNTWTDGDLHRLAVRLREMSKPMVIAANKIDMTMSKANLERLKAEFPKKIIVGCSAEAELALKEATKKGLIEYVPGEDSFNIINKEAMSEKQVQALGFLARLCAENDGTGVQRIINAAVFDMLRYKPIYPGGVNKLEDQHGNVLPDCFLMPPDATALDFAFRLHTEFGKNFIKAVNVKTKLYVGKDYVLESDDVIEIMYKK